MSPLSLLSLLATTSGNAMSLLGALPSRDTRDTHGEPLSRLSPVGSDPALVQITVIQLIQLGVTCGNRMIQLGEKHSRITRTCMSQLLIQ